MEGLPLSTRLLGLFLVLLLAVAWARHLHPVRLSVRQDQIVTAAYVVTLSLCLGAIRGDPAVFSVSFAAIAAVVAWLLVPRFRR